MGVGADKEGQRGTLKVDRFGQKVRQSRLRWYGRVKRWDDDSVGRKMQLPGTKEGVFGCGEGEHAGGRSEEVFDQSVWTIVCGGL